MPIINVQLVAGRPNAQKRELMRQLTKAAVDSIGAPEQSVRVILTEVPAENWGIGFATKAEV